MSHFKIKGGHTLNGKVQIAGAKNVVTKLLVASLISEKPCILTNVPNITEVEMTLELCQEIGMQVNWDKESRVLEVVTPYLNSTYVSQRFSGGNRIPILLLGALLGRTDEDIVIPTVGGCNIGQRPVDFHIQALEHLGATIEYRSMKKDGAYFAHAHQGLKGAFIELPYPSVGATENAMLAAVRAKGTTIIKNAAIEPEIFDIVLFLQKMGASIHIDVNRTIIIQGTTQFHEITHTVMPDKIEAASYATAAIATKGKIFIEGAVQAHLLTFLNYLRQIGGGFKVYENGIEFFYDRPLRGGIHIETDVHPGFITDWQQPFVVLLTQAEGSCVVHETVYENRFGYAETLKEMGAHISLFRSCLGSKPCRFNSKNFAHSLVVHGPTPLIGQEINIPDLRAGFSYVLAALIAEGSSYINNIHFVDRGYEAIDKKLSALGAEIERIEAPAPIPLERGLSCNLVSSGTSSRIQPVIANIP
ncbi:MAG: UDP-N-acetylglucosamine 1-carboxyvinyltransferase [Simkaniaceae bacterium]|nr:UDP-N-acetylglucosamine 1-carboxyvinyltransferase [Simkaniaceae bacterium]MCF7852286.1 UDP-N-acetylglucosamine 1-carboxyvinyltransferase [Simkaniaceae bacterium]